MNNNSRRILLGIFVFILLLTSCTGTPATPTPRPVIPTSVPSPILPTTAATSTETTAATAPATAAQPTPQPTVQPNAATFPDAGQFDWQQIATGFTKPTAMADPNDGSGRLLVLDQGGIILIVQNGSVDPRPFLDIMDRVGSSGSEQGLLGIALDPEYAANGIFFVNYTDSNGNTTISRFHRAPDGVHADPASEQVLFKVDQPFANHNGGNLVFGPDGMLYIGLGDGGSAGDPHGNGQNVTTLLGKMLRLDIRGKDTYTIPRDNPFAAGGGAQEVWAWGLRNPWRYSFDRVTGDLYIADVGQNKYEEVDFLPAGSPGGANFGWNYREGLHAYQGEPPAGANLVDPIFEYDHGQGCSITGGFVYRGSALPEFYGIYLVGDYCNGFIWGLMRNANGNWSSSRLFQTPANISSFGEDASGELYMLDHRTGSIFKLVRR